MLPSGIVCAATPSAVATDEITASVVRVVSGDTLVVPQRDGELEIRLADIGAPQGSEYYAPAARQLLSNMILNKTVRVVVTGRSGPGRIFGRVYAGKLDVNMALVQRAAAWMCLEYATQTDYLPYQNDAIRFRRGLWHQTTTFDALIRCRERPPAEHPVSKP